MRAKSIFCSLLFIVSSLVCVPVIHADTPVFIIGPGDVLEISVWKDETLSREIIVPPDGVISFPLIGDIDVKQMTVSDLRSQVTRKLSDFIPDATVTVILKQINSLKAYVIGKVRNPGEYPINLETNVMQLLSKAGGLNPYASESKIHILRQVKGNIVRIPFNYSEILKGRNLDQNIILKRGDVVVVP